ncbi:hypothetical protein OG302_00780 [Streptomyces sp. NBC_01283]|uniref:hypothetical protein n=1 Tax=Streptomyces sp. NBC_01283 TaxID=2903812 RepID=UPI00352BF5E6|nr:hypothetical protein OG302_00780 [Streptomyces sp. NBC_01283]
MAGILDVTERAVLGPDAAQESADPSWPGGGYTLHRYGRVAIVAVPEGPDVDLGGPEPGETDGLSEAEALGLAALRLRESEAYRLAKEKRPRAGETWDMQRCLVAGDPRSDSGERSAVPQRHSTNSEYMEGPVAVGIVFVQGPTAELRFNQDEVVQAVAEVQGGLGFFATANPVAGIRFVYDIQNVSLTVSPDPDAGTDPDPDVRAEKLEAVWRDPALAELGHTAGVAGVRSYIEDLRQRFSTQWTYCVFFARYPITNFAYARGERTHVVMDYDNGSYTPAGIDIVFAHETGHIFGCPDEYATATNPCDCGGAHGRYGLVNGNCESCAALTGVDCLMKTNALTLCQYTPGHLGWSPRLRLRDFGYKKGGYRTDRHVRGMARVTANRLPGIFAFAEDGVYLSVGQPNGRFGAAQRVVPDFGYQSGWRVDKHPRFMADITHRSGDDIVGFGEQGVWTALAIGDGTYEDATFVVADFGYQSGWRVDKHPRFMADITGNGTADIVGFGEHGVWTALSKGDGTFTDPRFVIADLGYESGWRVEKHPRFLARLTSDPVADIVGFGEHGVWTALSKGDGTFTDPRFVIADLGYESGWRVEKHPRLMAPLTGDPMADIVGFGEQGVWTALSKGDGTFTDPGFVIADFGYVSGWRVEKHPRLLADTTGDRGLADLVGFGPDGVWMARSLDNGQFDTPGLVRPHFGYVSGWRVEKHPRFLADTTGDGKADIVGFYDDGVWIARA